MGLVETSFRNLVSQGIQHLPLPGLLHFNTDRLERQALRKQIEELQASIHELKQQSVSKTGNLSATPPAQPSNHQQQPQASSRGNLPNQHEPAASQERRQAQKDIRSHSNLTQSKAAKPSSAAPPPPKPISTAIKPHHATKPTEAVVMQWELTHDRQAGAAASLPSTTGQQATAHANIGRTPDAEASSQASANASLGGTAELMSTVADTTISDHLQGSQADTGLPYTEANGIHSTPQDERQAADTTGEKAQLPAAEAGSPISTAAAAAAGWPGKPVSGHTSLDHISLIKQEHLADTTTGSLATREQAASSTDTAGDAGGSDEAQLNGLVTQEEQLLGHDHCISCCSFSPNGQNLATASTDGVVRIWAPESLQVFLIHPCSSGTALKVPEPTS